MSERSRFGGWVAVALLFTGCPAAAIVPVEDPGQWLSRMQGADLTLASPSGAALMQEFFMPRSPNEMPCLPSPERTIGGGMVCEYRGARGTEPELFLGIAGGAADARITSVVWRYPLPGTLWRCRPTEAQGGWHVCFPAGSDRGGDAGAFRGWERLLRSVEQDRGDVR